MGTTPPDHCPGQGRIRTFTILAAVFAAGTALGDTLPAKAPMPAPRDSAQQTVPAKPADAPLPDPRPAVADPEAQPPAKTDQKPIPRPQPEQPAEVDEKPTPRPQIGEPPSETRKPPSETGDEKKPDTPPPALESPPSPETSPAQEAACRQRLTALGTKFEERPPLSDPNGCSLPHPLSLTALSGSIDVQPEALVNCATAEAVARFSTDVSKLAKQELGSELKSIQQASGYVCRPRNGTSKLSEHAFGNAFDIASFTLVDGTVVEVTATRHPKQSQFLSKVRTAACGPFKTVLGPGSDADHATHFHLDLAMRRNGSTFCQ